MTSATDRRGVSRAAADALDAARPRLSQSPSFIGFDGCVDSIIHVVDIRRGPGDYQRMTSIAEFAERIARAAGKSANIEFVVTQKKIGGNAAIMGWALQSLGVPVTLAGAMGDAAGVAVEPVLQQLADNCREVIVTGGAASTDAAEFSDGKIMLGKNEIYQTLSYERLKEVAGLERLVRLADEAALIATVNWTMLPGMGDIWRGLIDEVLPRIDRSRQRRMFVDLADPAKRTAEDLRAATVQLSALSRLVPLTLGLNLSEAAQVAGALGLPTDFAAGAVTNPRRLEEAAEAVRAQLELDCVLIHPSEGAAGANAAGEVAWLEGSFTRSPQISTGGGDHFNAGAALALLCGLPLEQVLAVGTSVSGFYVRRAKSPTFDDLLAYLDDPPASEA